MLEKMVEKYRIIDAVGNDVGKIKDVYLNIKTWNVSAIEYSPGALKKDRVFKIDQINRMDYEKSQIILNEGFEDMEKVDKAKSDLYPFQQLKKLNVVDKDGEKVGKVYNLDIPIEKLKDFKVWKVLIKVGMKERRLRLPTSEISSVMTDINLAKSLEEYQEKVEN